MSIVKERIVLRRHRRAGERIPRRIVLDKLETGDSLLVEIVIDRQKDLVKCYLFDPKRLEGRRSVTFRVSGEEVYWLGGASPKPLLHQQAERMFAEQKQSEKSKHGGSQSGRRPKIFKTLIFDKDGSLTAICPSLTAAAHLVNLRPEAIDKLCHSKRPSFETGLSFRYCWKVLDFDISDFTLTTERYDELCRRKPKRQN